MYEDPPVLRNSCPYVLYHVHIFCYTMIKGKLNSSLIRIMQRMIHYFSSVRVGNQGTLPFVLKKWKFVYWAISDPITFKIGIHAMQS